MNILRLWNCPQMNATIPHRWWANTGSGKGFVPSDNRPLPEPMLTKFSDAIARRHGHVFRMALHNEGDWRMETWQLARQGELSCLHTPIPELCNAILNTCQMPSRFYIIPSNVNKSQTHLLKPFIARDLMESHIYRQNTLMFAGVLFWTASTCRPHVLSLPSRCEKSDSWRQARSDKTANKSWTVPQCGHVTLNQWIVYKWPRSKQMLSFHRTFFNLLDFTVSLSCRDCHSETPWSHSSNQPGGTYCQA